MSGIATLDQVLRVPGAASFKQLSDISHRPKQLHGLVRERHKALLLIKRRDLSSFASTITANEAISLRAAR